MTERAEPASVLRASVVARLAAELRAALKRRSAREAMLGGALSLLAMHSAALRRELETALEVLVRRGSFERPLYSTLARGLAEGHDPRVDTLLASALETSDGGGLVTLGAAALCNDLSLAKPLAKAAVNRHAHVAFAAEVARVARGESNGAHAVAVAPMIKEAHRIALCQDVLSPCLWQASVGTGLVPALAALRCAERHIGRWLLLAELGVRAGDPEPYGEAKREAAAASLGARPAWELVGWALAPPGAELATRPNLELVTRLSDRPTVEGDVSFLFRLAATKLTSVRALLRHLTRGPLDRENGVRAAFHLAHDYGDERAQQQLLDAARAPRREPIRGLAVAALFDLGQHGVAVDAAATLTESRSVATLTWSCLVLTAASGKESSPLMTESRVRKIQLGWLA
jgi:hypothetical protein